MDPLDDVVANIHRVSAFGKQIDAEGSRCPSGCLECLVPPTRALDQRSANRLGCAAIDIVLDRSDGLAVGRTAWIFLDEAVTKNEALCNVVTKRCRQIAERGREVACARIERTRGESRRRKRDEGVTFAQRHGVRVRRDVGDVRSFQWAFGSEGEHCFYLSIFRKRFGVIERDGGSCWIDMISALVERGQCFYNTMSIVKEEIRGVHEHTAGRIFCGDRKAPKDGLGKGLRDGESLGGVRGGAAEVAVRLNQQNLRPGPLEANNATFR